MRDRFAGALARAESLAAPAAQHVLTVLHGLLDRSGNVTEYYGKLLDQNLRSDNTKSRPFVAAGDDDRNAVRPKLVP
jgi:hypothetical protein